MKVGLFFGTFNPIHTGHLIIASYFAGFTDLKKIWFVVSPQNPLKDKATMLNEKNRLYMVNIAVENDARFKASNIEFHLPKPSFTIDTLAYLAEKYPKHEFVLIIGSDNLDSIERWKNYERLMEEYEIYVYKRKSFTGDKWKNHKKIKVFDVPLLDISATFIRISIKQGKNMSHFLPDAVYKYIEEMNFYK